MWHLLWQLAPSNSCGGISLFAIAPLVCPGSHPDAKPCHAAARAAPPLPLAAVPGLPQSPGVLGVLVREFCFLATLRTENTVPCYLFIYLFIWMTVLFWRYTFTSCLTGVTFRGWGLVPCVGVTDTGASGFHGSVAVPVTGVGVTAVPVIRSRDLLFPLRVLNSIEQGSAGMGQDPAHCSDSCLSGFVRVTAYFFQVFH